jgi:hypothetical protein
MHVISTICLILILFGLYSYYKEDKQHKQKFIASTTPAIEPVYRVNFGNEITILGHKFINDENDFYFDKSKTYWFSQTNDFVNHFGISPNIRITQDEFLKRLDALK